MALRVKSLLALLAVFLVVTGVGACGSSSSPPDPLSPFKTQSIDWKPCDPTIVPEPVRQNLADLGTDAACAFMRVPMDYANPGSGELKIALLRVAAMTPSLRRGAILLNPGGPGGDGLPLAPSFAALWRGVNPVDPVGAIYWELAQRYDLVGFSPRGTGASTQLDCSSPEELSFVANPSADRSAANIEAQLRNARIEAAACRTSRSRPS